MSQTSVSGYLEVGRFGMNVNKGWDNSVIISAPYAGLGLDNYGKARLYKSPKMIDFQRNDQKIVIANL